MRWPPRCRRGTTLAQLTQTVANSSPQSTQAPSGVPSLPAEMLLKTAAANCPSFRSGTYRVIHPMDDSSRTARLEIDAASLTATWIDVAAAPASTTLTPNGDCEYIVAFDGQQGKLAVSPAGVGVLVFPWDPGVYHAGLMFPEQRFTTADLAGEWNTLEWERMDTSSSFSTLSGDVTFSPEGQLLNMRDCASPRFEDSTCVAEAAGSESFAALASGGFNLVVDGTYEEGAQMFAYRAGGGEMMFAMVDPTNTLIVGTRKRTLTLPRVGDKVQTWSAAIHADGHSSDGGSVGVSPAPGEFSETSWTITAIDEAAGTYVRSNDAGTQQQSFAINSPRAGFQMRQAGADVSEMIFMPLRGMGFTALSRVVDPGTPGIFLLAASKQ